MSWRNLKAWQKGMVVVWPFLILFSFHISDASGTSLPPPPEIVCSEVSDIDGDSKDEIIIFFSYGGNFAINSSGNYDDYEGECGGENLAKSLPYVVDIDGDGSPNNVTWEMCHNWTYNPSYGESFDYGKKCISVSELNGSLLWKYDLPYSNSRYVSDLEGDGLWEIVIIRHSSVQVLENDGLERFNIGFYSILDERLSPLREEKAAQRKEEEKNRFQKTIYGILLLAFLVIISKKIRNILKPNRVNVGVTILFGLIPFPIGFFPVPIILIFIFSILGGEINYFSFAARVLFGVYILFSFLPYSIRLLKKKFDKK